MKPDLDKLKERISANRDLVDRITRQLPGYEGYVEKTEMYNADRIVREYSAGQLKKLKDELESHSAEMFRAKRTAILADLEPLTLLIEKVYKKCLHADYGSTASLSRIKLGPDDMNRLLEYDWRLVDRLAAVGGLAGSLESLADDELKKKYGEIKNMIRDFDKALDDRKDVIMEVI